MSCICETTSERPADRMPLQRIDSYVCAGMLERDDEGNHAMLTLRKLAIDCAVHAREVSWLAITNGADEAHARRVENGLIFVN